MSTTVTISIHDQRQGLLATSPAPRTELNITRNTKGQAIAEAITMLVASHRPELERAWSDLRAQVEPLLQAYRDMQPAEVTAVAEK